LSILNRNDQIILGNLCKKVGMGVNAQN
jgi:hypothetical protein